MVLKSKAFPTLAFRLTIMAAKGLRGGGRGGERVVVGGRGKEVGQRCVGEWYIYGQGASAVDRNEEE